MVSDFLQRSEAFMIPESSVAMREYLSNVFEVCSALATDPVSALRDLQISLENHGKKIVVENKRLLSENDSLERKLFDLKTVQIHIVDDNEELQGSLLNINEDRRAMGQRFRQCEDAFYNLRSNNEAVLRELSVTQKQLQDSIREQWRYYECLKRHGLVS
jgi:regulator of replication initiation timing